MVNTLNYIYNKRFSHKIVHIKNFDLLVPHTAAKQANYHRFSANFVHFFTFIKMYLVL